MIRLRTLFRTIVALALSTVVTNLCAQVLTFEGGQHWRLENTSILAEWSYTEQPTGHLELFVTTASETLRGRMQVTPSGCHADPELTDLQRAFDAIFAEEELLAEWFQMWRFIPPKMFAALTFCEIRFPSPPTTQGGTGCCVCGQKGTARPNDRFYRGSDIENRSRCTERAGKWITCPTKEFEWDDTGQEQSCVCQYATECADEGGGDCTKVIIINAP